jgi:NitT/TauT family transport system ATP-binding protein
MAPQTPLIMAEHLTKTFPLPEGKGTFTVLKDVSVTIHAGEVVALLGRSGSGKSTLLRMLAGLIPPSAGAVKHGDQVVIGANPHVTMVFQSFALLPWATVQENVELGLKARGIPQATREERAFKAIDTVGLGGFESAYPKELSGGMQQRVGFARALVMEPDVLFMDEPFSALDVLTAENLRGEISMLWEAGTFPAKSILIVTHNIEEAVWLSDRVVILSTDPGQVRGEVRMDLARPRERNSAKFKELVDYIYSVMTHPEAEVTLVPTSRAADMPTRFPPLPHARAGGISGLLELVVDRGGQEEIPQLAERLHLDVDDLFPIIDAAVILGFANVDQGELLVTHVGREFAETDILHAKELFRQQTLAHVPLVATIYQTLQQKDNHEIRADFFLDILDEYYSANETMRQFETAVDWGRYAELFEYEASERRLSLPTNDEAC